MHTGLFITLEGGEGCGKSTQAKWLAEALSRAGRTVCLTREPGGAASTAPIRQLLVEGATERWTPLAETLLFYADRVQHLHETITPALARGEAVVCDRFADSTLVYQAYAGGLAPDFVRTLQRLVIGNTAPHLTLLLDIAPETGLARAAARRGHETRFEGKTLEFHHKVRDGFLAVAAREPARFAVIDAAQSIAAVQQQIADAVEQRLGVVLP